MYKEQLKRCEEQLSQSRSDFETMKVIADMNRELLEQESSRAKSADVARKKAEKQLREVVKVDTEKGRDKCTSAEMVNCNRFASRIISQAF